MTDVLVQIKAGLTRIYSLSFGSKAIFKVSYAEALYISSRSTNDLGQYA
jgi:hypothetical protein